MSSLNDPTVSSLIASPFPAVSISLSPQHAEMTQYEMAIYIYMTPCTQSEQLHIALVISCSSQGCEWDTHIATINSDIEYCTCLINGLEIHAVVLLLACWPLLGVSVQEGAGRLLLPWLSVPAVSYMCKPSASQCPPLHDTAKRWWLYT